MDSRPPVSKTWWACGGKRVFDVAAALVLLILLSPLFLLACLLIKLTGPGPVFFRQTRIGKGGLPFRMIKFRSMRADRTPDPLETVPLTHPEITPIGRYLRRFKIDEAPQLFLVLTGKMSLIGPRPTLPDQVEKYDAFRRQRLLVRPGITGLAQINGNTSISWDERILFDIAYVRCCSLRLDLAILWKTLGVILKGERPADRRFVDSPWSEYVTPSEGYCSSNSNE